MKTLINGWPILAAELDRFPGARNILTDLIGRRFDLTRIADGRSLLNAKDFELIFQLLNTDIPNRLALLDMVISGRQKLFTDGDIQPLMQLLSQTAAAASSIPCIPFDRLKNFHTGTLFDFVLQHSSRSLDMIMPPGACALQIPRNDTAYPDLPPGTVIILNGTSPGATGETALVKYRGGKFAVTALPLGHSFIWSAPVLRISFPW